MPHLSTAEFAHRIVQGDRLALSRAITLIESQVPAHRTQSLELLDKIYNQRTPSFRIGLTGIPGVGKSTFIEALGKEVIESGNKLAVLAIDPSSTQSKGSILGDKTRMGSLSRAPEAFIRPSPSAGTLGGIAARTRETMLLCEAAGFDTIIIETVGVGQSETEALFLTDVFLMLAMPGTGDELQGIKRGIMEAADLIVINKADGSNESLAKQAKKQLEIALHLFPAKESEWRVKVLLASGLHGLGVKECWKRLKAFREHTSSNGFFEANRITQNLRAFERLSEMGLYDLVRSVLGDDQLLSDIQAQLENGSLNEYAGALQILEPLRERFGIPKS